MQAIRVHPAPPSEPAYSPTNPAPPSALHLDTIAIPKPTEHGQLLVRIKATTIIRDMLTWPETYERAFPVLGHDFSGIVTEVFSGASNSSDSSSGDPGSSALKPSDEVFGMAHADRGSTWAEYALVTANEVALKPRGMGWEEAAALPLSAQTAYEALFEHAGIPAPSIISTSTKTRQDDADGAAQQLQVLVTGAAGGVGIYLVQLAASAGVHVVAATSSNERNESFLRGLGADEVVEYGQLENDVDRFDVIVDAVGGDVLTQCWKYVKGSGTLVTVDSASFDFVAEHRRRGISREGVKALFFIVEGSGPVLRSLADLVDRGRLKSFVAESFPIARAKEAYEYANGRYSGRGKILLTL
ncbi:Polyketide synthase enoylreductase [Penicillium alfredii]|uniref:Polyketide synthase enoylreductase n=1 Tax=Penicillium alfredii TaxID=1506179 RepID=A0A9W9JWV8_9EURO|nr:Polyketide synthase enoylreductase [Penicillium alfredii]KAJ5084568.1 Polyketide synthase enoylreductase [Penicillium alfredii]